MKCSKYCTELKKVIQIPLENRNLYEILLSCPESQAKFIIKNNFFENLYEDLPEKVKERLEKNNSTLELEINEINKFMQNQEIIQFHQEKVEADLQNLKNYKFLYEFSDEIKKRYSYYTMAYNLFTQRSTYALKKYNKAIRKYYIYHISKSTKNELKLLSYDIEKNEKTEKLLNSDIFENMASYFLLLPIPDFSLFIYGNEYTDSRIIFTLNMTALTVDFLSQDNFNWNVGGTYYKKFVYIFGGINNEGFSSQAKKFDLNLRKFIELKNLPQFSQFCSCIPFNGNILVCGYQHTNIFIYDIIINNYFDAKLNVKTGRKILLEANERVYVFEAEGKIYESSPKNIKSWAIIGENQIQGENIYAIYYMSHFLFGSTKFNQFEEQDGGKINIFAFDLKHKNINNWIL